jgi:hypothetical protein
MPGGCLAIRIVTGKGWSEMTSTAEQISGLLHEAGETHHRVFRIVDGPTTTGHRGTRSG